MRARSEMVDELPIDSSVDWERVTTGTRNELRCAMCTNCVVEGTECTSCQQIFCMGCCQDKTNTQCPSCLKPDCFDVENRNLSAERQKAWNEVRVTCKYQSLGCQEVIALKDLIVHEDALCSALSKSAECSGCKATFTAQDYLIHENSCDLLEMQCKNCHMTLPKKLKKEHTRVVCLFQKMKAAENTAIKELMHMKSNLSKIMSKAKNLNNYMMVECKSCSKYCGHNMNTKCANCQDQYCIRCSKNSKSCQNPNCGSFYCKSCGVDKLYSNRKCRLCNMQDHGLSDKRGGYGQHHLAMIN